MTGASESQGGDVIEVTIKTVSIQDIRQAIVARQHPVWVPVGAFMHLLHRSNVLALRLRHLIECEGSCRASLPQDDVEPFLQCAVQTFGGALLEDTPERPEEFPERGKELLHVYAVLPPAEMLTLLDRTIAVDNACQVIAESKFDARASKLAITVAYLMEKYADWVLDAIQDALDRQEPREGLVLDALEYTFMDLRDTMREVEARPETPREKEEREKLQQAQAMGQVVETLRARIEESLGMRPRRPPKDEIN